MKKNKLQGKREVARTLNVPKEQQISRAISHLLAKGTEKEESAEATYERYAKASQPTEFKMRAECLSDLNIIKAHLQPWLAYWDTKHVTTEHKGQLHELPDVEVEFGINPGGPSLAEIRGLFYGIDDCHVAEETVALARDYTGDRVPLDETDSLLEPPNPEHIKLMTASVVGRRDYLEIERRRAERAISMLSEVAITGERTPRDRAGFIAMVEHKATGMMSIRRISDTKKDVISGGDPVKERMVLLEN